MRVFCFLLFFYSLTACVSTEPNKEYAIAQSALRSAKKFSADKLFPRTYLKSLFFYKKGTSQYKKQNYEGARNSFEKAIKLAEKAEFKARLKQRKEAE